MQRIEGTSVKRRQKELRSDVVQSISFPYLVVPSRMFQRNSGYDIIISHAVLSSKWGQMTPTYNAAVYTLWLQFLGSFLSVRRPAWNNSAFTWRILMKFDT